MKISGDRAAEDGRRPARRVEDRRHEIGQVVDLDEQERHRQHQHEQRVEDDDPGGEEPDREQHSGHRRRLAALVKRDPEQDQAGEEVRHPRHLEPAGGDQELRVGRLEQHEVERAEADLLDGGHRRRLDHRRQHALDHQEERRDQQRLGPGPARHSGAQSKQHEQRNQRAHRPEDAEREREKEVEPVLERHQERHAGLQREQARIAGDARGRTHAARPNRRTPSSDARRRSRSRPRRS